MIVLFTDFGLSGPYTGQMKAVLGAAAPNVPAVDLFADLPAGNVKAAAYLLAAYDDAFAAGAVFLCVVDPGVGSERRAVAVKADGRWYVGPDNGLFEPVLRRAAAEPEAFEITWVPDRLSASFHGRDLFAPIAARIAGGEDPAGAPGYRRLDPATLRRPDWPDDLAEVVYIDRYGNAMTGIRACAVDAEDGLAFGIGVAPRARTFSSVSPSDVFCYENSNGLIEIAVNRGNAGGSLDLGVGRPVTPIKI
ncbi:MAG: SAM-dependent chlorinase/fluorinase [Rhodospirillaceae bacterium]